MPVPVEVFDSLRLGHARELVLGEPYPVDEEVDHVRRQGLGGLRRLATVGTTPSDTHAQNPPSSTWSSSRLAGGPSSTGELSNPWQDVDDSTSQAPADRRRHTGAVRGLVITTAAVLAVIVIGVVSADRVGLEPTYPLASGGEGYLFVGRGDVEWLQVRSSGGRLLGSVELWVDADICRGDRVHPFALCTDRRSFRFVRNGNELDAVGTTLAFRVMPAGVEQLGGVPVATLVTATPQQRDAAVRRFAAKLAAIQQGAPP